MHVDVSTFDEARTVSTRTTQSTVNNEQNSLRKTQQLRDRHQVTRPDLFDKEKATERQHYNQICTDIT